MNTINKERLEDLLRTERKIKALEAGGVDNWDWYSESLQEFNKQEEDEKRFLDLLSEDDVQWQLAELFRSNNLTFKDLDEDQEK